MYVALIRVPNMNYLNSLARSCKNYGFKHVSMIAENLCSPTDGRGNQKGEEALCNAHGDSGTVNSSFNSAVQVSLLTSPTYISPVSSLSTKTKVQEPTGRAYVKTAYNSVKHSYNHTHIWKQIGLIYYYYLLLLLFLALTTKALNSKYNC